jgi:hypothetical protein
VSFDGWVDEFDEPSPRAGERSPGLRLFGAPKEHVPGRKWDNQRDADPVISRNAASEASPWKTFVKSSMYGPPSNEDREPKGAEILGGQTPGYMRPWRGDSLGDDPEKLGRRKLWYQRAQVCTLADFMCPI